MWIQDKEQILSTFRLVDSSVILTTKDSSFWWTIAKILEFFHIMKASEFLSHYATTIGPLQAYPAEWTTEDVLAIGSHECRHTKQARKFGLNIHPWVGVIPMAITYLLLPFPILLGWCRYRLELDADKGYWNYLKETGFSDEEIIGRAKFCAEKVSSSAYGYSVPKSWALWGFNRAVRKFLGL
jgi:hypothetical protein